MNSFVFISIIFAISICVCIIQVKADDEFYDTRCICICPSLHTVDATIPETNRKVYIEIMGKENCKCEKVIGKQNLTESQLGKVCPRCTCSFEVRNTTTMKIVVIIIICILALLFIYMGFLLCLDPLMNRRSRLYQEQMNEELSMTSESRSPESDDTHFVQSPGHSRSNVINRVTQEQSKWKRQVQEQRRTVYDKHGILN